MAVSETNEQSALPTNVQCTAARPRSGSSRSGSTISPQTCSSCQTPAATNVDVQGASPSYVYALGRIQARFPRVSVEKEFAQAVGRTATTGQTDQEVFKAVLSKRENRYLARHLCWVMTVQGIDTYILQPRDPADLDLLVATLRSAASPLEIDAVIGLLGPIAGPEVCNGLMIPILSFDQIYSFGRDALIQAIPRPDEPPKGFDAAAGEVFDRVMQLADNAGGTDEHRALNYLVMRYPKIYGTVADAHSRNASLTGVDVQPSPLSGARRMVDVILTFTNRNNDFTEKYCTRVDVTEEFPFLAARMSEYFDR